MCRMIAKCSTAHHRMSAIVNEPRTERTRAVSGDRKPPLTARVCSVRGSFLRSDHMPLFTMRRGFTFVELLLGMIVTTIVLGALAVFTFAVSENWRTSDSAQSAFLAGSMGVDRLNQLVRSAQAIDSNPTNGSLTNATAPAACMLWTDANADTLIEYSEMTLLKFDQANQRLVAYAIPSTAANATTQTATLMTAASFLALPNVVATPIVHDVSACQIFSINAGSASPRPSLEIILQMKTSNGSSQTLVYTTATLRGPANPT
jgi:hypothetical protein